jgi:hypothetical protein
MGVSVPFKDLKPRVLNGRSFSSHQKLCACVDGQVICIDGAQWIFEGLNSHRIHSILESQTSQNVSDKVAARLSVALLFIDRVRCAAGLSCLPGGTMTYIEFIHAICCR